MDYEEFSRPVSTRFLKVVIVMLIASVVGMIAMYPQFVFGAPNIKGAPYSDSDSTMTSDGSQYYHGGEPAAPYYTDPTKHYKAKLGPNGLSIVLTFDGWVWKCNVVDSSGRVVSTGSVIVWTKYQLAPVCPSRYVC